MRAQKDTETAADVLRPSFGLTGGTGSGSGTWDPAPMPSAADTPEERWKTQRFMNYGPPPTSTTSNRTVTVSPGAVERAWGLLNSRMRNDHIRDEFMRRQRYEDPKVKRRRIRSERHRRKFAHFVGKKVKMVMKMKDMGM
jgi:ribosomal protein S21